MTLQVADKDVKNFKRREGLLEQKWIELGLVNCTENIPVSYRERLKMT